MSTISTQVSRKTRWALFLSGLLNEPLVGLISLLPFILRKDLHATAFQISLFSTVKPAVALLSFYWGATLWRNQQKLRANWIGAWFLARLPFFIFPFVQNIWLFIIGAAVFQLFQRAAMPAQMEILKQNVPQGARENFFSWSSAFNFFGGVIIGMVFGIIMDHHSWQLLFLLSGGIGLLSMLIQTQVPINHPAPQETHLQKNNLLTPWKDSLNLLKQRPDFARYQLGFMLGGIGLMLIMPALVLYSVDVLGISHAEMTTSRFVLMGLGYVLTTPIWKKRLSYEGIFKLTAVACLLFGVTTLSWIFAIFHSFFFFLAYFLYGVAQAGSHLTWHLSGPIFAGKNDSSLFSTVNILTVGLRGLIVPCMASLLCELIGPLPVLGIGIVGCLAGSMYLFAQKQEVRDAPNPAH